MTFQANDTFARGLVKTTFHDFYHSSTLQLGSRNRQSYHLSSARDMAGAMGPLISSIVSVVQQSYYMMKVSLDSVITANLAFFNGA